MINTTVKTKKGALSYHNASSGTTPAVCILYFLEIGVNVLVLLLVCTHLIVVPESSMVEVMEMAQVSSLMVVGDHVSYKHRDSFVCIQVSLNPVDAIISGDIKSLEQLSIYAPEVMSWLKHNLPLAHTDEDLKKKIKALLGYHHYSKIKALLLSYHNSQKIFQLA